MTKFNKNHHPSRRVTDRLDWATLVYLELIGFPVKDILEDFKKKQESNTYRKNQLTD
jgi:hypothetical protein